MLSESFTDYSGTRKTLELRASAITPGQDVILVDDWVETGAQLRAAIRLVERAGGRVTGIVALFAEENGGTKQLFTDYGVRAIGRSLRQSRAGRRQ